MLPSWMIVDRLGRELQEIRSMGRDAEGRAGAARRPAIAQAHQAVAAAELAVAAAALDLEGGAVCLAWRSLAQARAEVARTLRAMERRRRDRVLGARLGHDASAGVAPGEGP